MPCSSLPSPVGHPLVEGQETLRAAPLGRNLSRIRQDLPRSRGTPLSACSTLRPRWGRASLARARVRQPRTRQPSAAEKASAPTAVLNYGAPSRSLQTRCLRFAASVTRVPRKTRFHSVASLLGGIYVPPRVPQQGFCPMSRHVAPPCPSLVAQLSYRVAPGGCPPGAPTDPSMRNSRTGLLRRWLRYTQSRSGIWRPYTV